MVGETADPVLLSSRAGGRWLTAGAFVLAAALLATQSFDLKRSAAPKPDFAMEFRIAETVKPAPAPTPEVKKVPEVKPEFPIYLYIAGFRRQFSSPSRSKTSLWRPKISPSQTFPVDEL